MTLFNSANPRIAAAQAKVLETLTSIPVEYGAVFVIDDHQAELAEAVRARSVAFREAALQLNRLQADRPYRADADDENDEVAA